MIKSWKKQLHYSTGLVQVHVELLLFISANEKVTHIIMHIHAGVWEYIESTRDLVRDLERRVRLAKANVDNICTLMAGWSKSPLYKRKEDKKESLLNLEVRIMYTL